MILFEVINGFIGDSYVRVYVWAEDEETALKMASDAFKAREKKSSNPTPDYWQKLKIIKLFDDKSPAFVTEPSYEGWLPAVEPDEFRIIDNP